VPTAGAVRGLQQPDNIVRAAVEALTAFLGGTNSAHTNPPDEVLALPGKAASETTLRTPAVLMEETGVANATDPLGASSHVEAPTTTWTRSWSRRRSPSRTWCRRR
jgi:methylmalonyl-CoA mutase N-terminal domain/subunit